MRLGQLDPITGGFAAVSTLVNFGADIYSQKRKEDSVKKAAVSQKRREARLAEERRLAVAAARGQQTLDLGIELSQQRRREQQTAMIFVGGVAVLISGMFIFSALRKRRPTGGA